MIKNKTKHDKYTNKKLLINKVEDIFRIDNIEFGRIDGLKYAILTIDNDEYITYSKVILNQLKNNNNFRNESVVLKEFRTNEFGNKKYHILYVVGNLL